MITRFPPTMWWLTLQDERERPTIDELLHHEWVEDPAGDQLYAPQVHPCQR